MKASRILAKTVCSTAMLVSRSMNMGSTTLMVRRCPMDWSHVLSHVEAELLLDCTLGQLTVLANQHAMLAIVGIVPVLGCGVSENPF